MNLRDLSLFFSNNVTKSFWWDIFWYMKRVTYFWQSYSYRFKISRFSFCSLKSNSATAISTEIETRIIWISRNLVRVWHKNCIQDHYTSKCGKIEKVKVLNSTKNIYFCKFCKSMAFVIIFHGAFLGLHIISIWHV